MLTRLNSYAGELRDIELDCSSHHWAEGSYAMSHGSWGIRVFRPLKLKDSSKQTMLYAGKGSIRQPPLTLMEMVTQQLITYVLQPYQASEQDPIRPSWQSTTLDVACEWFVQQVKTVEAVKNVLVERTRNGINIWTILDREPGNRELRYRIYEIEAQTLDKYPELLADFKVLNLAEFNNPDLLHLPSAEGVVYQRE